MRLRELLKLRKKDQKQKTKWIYIKRQGEQQRSASERKAFDPWNAEVRATK